jgi:recombination associated protein RdgC
MLLVFRAEKKLLPASVVTQVTKARALEVEEQQGFKLGRKQMRELKEQVTDELLPRAFSIRRDTRVWIDTVHGWLVIDASSQAVADEVLGLLVKSIDQLPLASVRVAQSPVAAMTEWLVSGEAPAGFTLDQDTELRSPAQGNATVRYVGHALDVEDMRRHIEAGKQCMRLAMTWNDRISFVLTPSLTIKRVAAPHRAKRRRGVRLGYDADDRRTRAHVCRHRRGVGRRTGRRDAASCSGLMQARSAR